MQLVGRGKRISYCAFEIGSAPVGANIWNGGALISIIPLNAADMRNADILQKLFYASGVDTEWVISKESDYPIPAGIIKEQ